MGSNHTRSNQFVVLVVGKNGSLQVLAGIYHTQCTAFVQVKKPQSASHGRISFPDKVEMVLEAFMVPEWVDWASIFLRERGCV